MLSFFFCLVSKLNTKNSIGVTYHSIVYLKLMESEAPFSYFVKILSNGRIYFSAKSENSNVYSNLQKRQANDTFLGIVLKL